jgi:hypothetical protein
MPELQPDACGSHWGLIYALPIAHHADAWVSRFEDTGNNKLPDRPPPWLRTRGRFPRRAFGPERVWIGRFDSSQTVELDVQAFAIEADNAISFECIRPASLNALFKPETIAQIWQC